tara:strand:+ start:319 stop:498 length:180 start_codon:yes stop_codon:yes gene_type:complete
MFINSFLKKKIYFTINNIINIFSKNAKNIILLKELKLKILPLMILNNIQCIALIKNNSS